MKRKNAAYSAIIIILILYMSLSVSAAEITEVYPGGMPFGIRFGTGQLSVSGFENVDGEDCPSKSAGLLTNDIIEKINGKALSCPEDVTNAVKNSGGKPLEFTVKRQNTEKKLTVIPKRSRTTGEYRIGLWLRDGSAGLGTVTFIIPETGEFGGLGHSICDPLSGEKCDISHGAVSHITVTDISKGMPGNPGELRGVFLPGKWGTVIKNTDSGVFGALSDIPSGKTVSVSKEIKPGDATVLCTVTGSAAKEYTAEISENRNGDGSVFFVRITDRELLERTGGIVQGMSGSPVLQEGKLVGAITHVLVGDPTRGYGITVEKMLETMGK